ncbi:NAD-dependent DNA ligase LigA [Brevibacillus sp. NPDC003359]|uniref:NAD-dependent DNA ligase LigA n=1 Tax=unclassified Brevibacillus TaxID=2684853 RepID=UPI0036C264F7
MSTEIDLFSFNTQDSTFNSTDLHLRMNQLVKEISEHDYYYHVLDRPVISDSEYDQLYRELVKLESELNLILPSSPSIRVGGGVLEGFQPHRHLTHMGSLDKVYNFDELRQWYHRTQKLVGDANLLLTTELKYDGLTLVLTYENGFLQAAATRGDGDVGENVLQQVMTIKSIPLEIPFKKKIEINGEGIMKLSVLKNYNETAEKKLKHARNAAAGAIRNLDPKITAQRKLDAFWYNIGYIEGVAFTNQLEMTKFLVENGFKVQNAPSIKVFDNVESLIEEILVIEALRTNLDFLIDGVVIKVFDMHTRVTLGTTAKFPRWGCAYKFDAEQISTPLIRVENQVGRTGKVTPVGYIEPVNIDGADVSKATLNNYDNIKEKGLQYAIGSQVFIRRSGDVIPEIVGLVSDNEVGQEIFPPTECPSCSESLVKLGADLFCKNQTCEAQIINKIVHFSSRDCMNIDGFSEKTAELLYQVYQITSPAGLYQLTYDHLIVLEKYGDKKVRNLLQAIQSSKECSLAVFLHALGIPDVGKVTAKSLANHFGSIEQVMAASREELLRINNIGENIAESIVTYFEDRNNIFTIQQMLAEGVNPINAKTSVYADESNPLYGKTVVITGTFSIWGRSELTSLVEKMGANVTGSVSKKTHLVLVGDNAGSKLEKAKTLGIEIWDEGRIRSILSIQ